MAMWSHHGVDNNFLITNRGHTHRNRKYCGDTFDKCVTLLLHWSTAHPNLYSSIQNGYVVLKFSFVADFSHTVQCATEADVPDVAVPENLAPVAHPASPEQTSCGQFFSATSQPSRDLKGGKPSFQ